jgi:hypothetical protein
MAIPPDSSIQAHLRALTTAVTGGNVGGKIDHVVEAIKTGLHEVADAIDRRDGEQPGDEILTEDMAEFLVQGVVPGSLQLTDNTRWSSAFLRLRIGDARIRTLKDLAGLGDPEDVVDDLLNRLRGRRRAGSGRKGLPTKAQLLRILEIAHQLSAQ